MLSMRVTRDVSQASRASLKTWASVNMESIRVTDDVSQLFRGSLNVPAFTWHSLHSPRPQNKYDMSVTSPVAHAEMGPCAASAVGASSSQARTAVRMVESVMTLSTVGRGVGTGAGFDVGSPGSGVGSGVGHGVGRRVG